MRAQCLIALVFQLLAFPGSRTGSGEATPLAIGETFTLQSKVLNETRRINVYLPPGYADAADKRFPVLYMPDGGLAEDFLHVAGSCRSRSATARCDRSCSSASRTPSAAAT